MDRDKIIAVVLIVGFFFLIFALLGVVAVTGFVLFSNGGTTTISSDSSDAADDNMPVWQLDSTSGEASTNSNSDNSNNGTDSSNNNDDTTTQNNNNDEPAPVCGNNVKEAGEQCESDSQCSSTKECNSSCQCIDKPAEKVKLAGIIMEKPAFFCATDFNGKKGLAARILNFKNTGTTDYSYKDTIKITAVTGDVTDSVSTNAAYDFSAKAGKTAGIYGTNLARTSAPYVFLGSTTASAKFTVEFGNKYIEYEYTLKANDFSQAGCL